jgi:methionine-rich copper-binding protein CopC
MNRRALPLALALFLQAVIPAFGHAILLHAAPVAGSTVTGPDVPVELRFNARVDAKRSRLSLLLANGKSLPLTIQEQTSADTLRAKAIGLPPGDYRLLWQVLAADGHISRGEAPFTVK